MISIEKHLDLLGHKVEDRVTGLKGVVTTVTFDLYGCIQALVHSGIDKATGKPREQHWFDVARLRVTSTTRVMPRPDFLHTPATIAAGGKGPAEKPAPSHA